MGDTPCEVDCTLFGFISIMQYHMVGTIHETLVKGRLAIMYLHTLVMVG